MKFKELGYATQDAYFDAFFGSLLETNRASDFYVDWKKVEARVKKYLDEIMLLNALVKINDIDERRKHLEQTLTKYPKTRHVIPMIIAVDEKSRQYVNLLKVLPNNEVNYLKVDFSESSPKEVLQFCDDTGVTALLGKINDLHAYLTGVEVGMDTNARKNRSGSVFHKFVFEALKRNGVDIRKPTNSFDLGTRIKHVDGVIYKDGKEFAVVEINFFNGLGSKPIETVQSYIQLQEQANRNNLRFIFITDGPAWKANNDKVRQARTHAFEKIDYPLNYALAQKLIPKLLKQ